MSSGKLVRCLVLQIFVKPAYEPSGWFLWHQATFSPLDVMLELRRVNPSITSASTHLYRVQIGIVRRLAQEHNTMSPARARTQTARSGVEHTDHEATAPPPCRFCYAHKLNTLQCLNLNNQVTQNHAFYRMGNSFLCYYSVLCCIYHNTLTSGCEVMYLGSGKSPINLRIVIHTANAACQDMYQGLDNTDMLTRYLGVDR